LHNILNTKDKYEKLFTGRGNMFITNEIYKNETSNLLVKNKALFSNEIFNDIQKLSAKRQEYYYHRIKADLIEEEIENETKDIIK
jgi:hypothetical protein